MTPRSDLLYGRQGGRWLDQAPGAATAFFAHRRAELEAAELEAAELEAAELERTGEQLELGFS